ESWSRCPRLQKSLPIQKTQTWPSCSRGPKPSWCAISVRSRKPCPKELRCGSRGRRRHRECAPTSRKISSADSDWMPVGWITKFARLTKGGPAYVLRERRIKFVIPNCFSSEESAVTGARNTLRSQCKAGSSLLEQFGMTVFGEKT